MDFRESVRVEVLFQYGRLVVLVRFELYVRMGVFLLENLFVELLLGECFCETSVITVSFMCTNLTLFVYFTRDTL